MAERRRLSRRDFLRMAALGSMGATLAACATPTAEVIEKIVEVEVEKTVEVEVEVEKTVEVEKVVEKTVEVPIEVERTAVMLLHFFGKEADPRRAALDKILGEFNLASRNYAAEATFVPFGNINEKFNAGIAAGDPPNVVVHTGQNSGGLGLEGKALPIDSLFDASDLPAWDGDHWVAYPLSPWENTGVDGKKYGVPFLPDTRFLFMDGAAFEEAGLDPEAPPVTWDDLWAYADQLDVGSPGAWERIAFSPRWGNSFFMNWSYCKNLYMWDTLDDDGIPVLDRPEVRDLIAWYIEWRDRYGKEDLDAFGASYAGTADPFISGANPMMINGSWMPGRYQTTFPDFAVSYALHPKAPGSDGVHSSWGAGHCLFLPANNQNPEGGWSLIEFINEKERLTEWCISTGTFVGRLDAMADPKVAEALGPHWPVAVEQLQTTRRSDSQYGGWPTLEAHRAMEAVWDTDKDVGDALAEQQTILRQAIEDWRATHPDVDYAPVVG